MFYVCATVDEVQERLFVQYFFKEPNGTEDKDEIEQAMKKFETCLDYINSKLKHGPYICGQKWESLRLACVDSIGSKLKHGPYIKWESFNYIKTTYINPGYNWVLTESDLKFSQSTIIKLEKHIIS